MNLNIMGRHRILSKAVIAPCFISSNAFTTYRINQPGMAKNNLVNGFHSKLICPLLAESTALDQLDGDVASPSVISLSPLAEKVRELTTSRQLQEAIQLLKESSASQEHDFISEEKSYHIVLHALSESQIADAPEIADELLNNLLRQGFHPSSDLFNLVISIWSQTGRKKASKKCIGYLEDLWSYHEQTGEDRLVPMRSSYISTIHAISRSFFNRPEKEQAEKAEALLEEMEAKRVLYKQLAPNTIAVNAVL